MITISHNHAEGTTLTGSRKGDGVWEIARAHGFAYSRNVGIYVRGSRDKPADRWVIEAAASALRNAGHVVVVEVDDTHRDVGQVEADRVQRAEDRVERRTELAGRAEARSEALRQAGDEMLDRIPLGQPILVGHHSEGRDRRYRDRAFAKLDRAMVEHRTAEYHAQRAAGAEAHQRHREDPKVTARRVERLAAVVRKFEREGRAESPGAVQRAAELAYWRARLAELETSGEFRPWTREHFVKGDEVRLAHGDEWRPVLRVNAKSLTLPTGYSWNDTVPYDRVVARRRAGVALTAAPPAGE